MTLDVLLILQDGIADMDGQCLHDLDVYHADEGGPLFHFDSAGEGF